jgi:hypothetical protein
MSKKYTKSAVGYTDRGPSEIEYLCRGCRHFTKARNKSEGVCGILRIAQCGVSTQGHCDKYDGHIYNIDSVLKKYCREISKLGNGDLIMESLKDFAERLSAAEKRMDSIEKHLECAHGIVFEHYDVRESAKYGTLELAITLPEADIGGLRFNRQEVAGVFDLKEDGWYCCRNILFLSARNTEDDNSRDILSEYLESGEVKEAFAAALWNSGIEADIAEVALPSENGGIKQYHGVDWWYWLNDRYSGSVGFFCRVNHYGHTSHYLASSVGGCAPAFRAA